MGCCANRHTGCTSANKGKTPHRRQATSALPEVKAAEGAEPCEKQPLIILPQDAVWDGHLHAFLQEQTCLTSPCLPGSSLLRAQLEHTRRYQTPFTGGRSSVFRPSSPPTGWSTRGRCSLHLTASHRLPNGPTALSHSSTAIPAACLAGGPVYQWQIQQELGMALGIFNGVTHTREGEKELRVRGRRSNCVYPEMLSSTLTLPAYSFWTTVQTTLPRFVLFNIFFIYIKMIRRDWQHRRDSKSHCRLAL